MNPTPEMIEAIAKAIEDIDPNFGDDSYPKAIAKAVLTAALALLPGEPVAEQWCVFENNEQSTSWTPVGYGDRAGWEAVAKRKPDEYRIVTRPLYTSPAPHLSVDREGLLEEARASMLRMEWAAEQLASTRNMEVYDAMIRAGQTDALLEFDNARRAARDTISKLEGSSHAEA